MKTAQIPRGALIRANPKFFMRVMPLIEARQTDSRNGVPVRKLDLEMLLNKMAEFAK